ncbi:hypothetical protein [Occallatibacter riparius]|uniref:Uncharacterized protein n=1 Tax=Occallatibacter riparius TaxID=1002689 RepID=A0A9J7BNV1_9BACT|nr:hypothetical protein [Occallatibacter riparius]UWZ84400.1 hypothetical protein MOP44_00350 [Occallatibacter riparius]
MAIDTKVSFTDKAAAFSAAAAYGINERVINSWNPFLIRTPRVLVPVQLDALVIRPNEAAQGWADCRLKPSPQDPNPTRYDILPDPFTELGQQRASGVYLHWAVPDALTRGQAEGDTATFPALPDRWLVLRMSPSGRTFTGSKTGMRSIRGWVLRAGDKVPQHIDLDSFTEGAPSPDAINNPLTVTSLGDVAWTAYYDNCVDRLAFYDPLSDISLGPISYLVCGWYSNPALDPLGDHSVKSLTQFNAKMKELQWQLAAGELDESIHHARKYVVAARGFGLKSNVRNSSTAYNDALNANADAVGYAVTDEPSSMPEFDDQGMAMGPYSTDGSWWPNATLMHGSVVAIGWPGIGWPGNEGGLLSGEVGGPPAASSVNVAIGNTITEALAALVAQHNNKPDEARILEGFLLSSLADLEQPDGRARLDVLLHSNSFASIDGGFTTETINIPAMPDTPPPLPNPVNPAPGVFPSHGSKAGNPRQTAFDSGKFRNTVIEAQGFSTVRHSESLQTIRETEILSGGLASAINFVVPTPVQKQIPAHTEEVRRALPRLFYPSEPVFLLEGASRTFKHGGDTRFSQDNTLAVRLTGFCLTELSCPAVQNIPGVEGLPPRIRSTPDAILDRGVENGSIPPECEDLLRECILLDPSAAVHLAESALNPVAPFRGSATTRNAPPFAAEARTAPSTATINQVARSLMVEQTAWWATRDPRYDHSQLIALSGISGTLPSPIAITPPVRPWNPIHLDWQIEYIPSTHAVADWSLGEIDYSTDPKAAPATPDPGPIQVPANVTPDSQPAGSFTLAGRAHLTGGAATTAAASLRQAISQAQAAGGAGNLLPNQHIKYHSGFAEMALNAYAAMAADISITVTGSNTSTQDGRSAIDRSTLQDILDTLDSMDVLSGAADNLTRQMRGGNLPDGKSVPASGPIPPTPFIPLRAGFLRILRLRLVDGFGQFLDLAGSSDATNINALDLVESEPLEIPTRPELLALPPRFTSPSRLWFRYMTAEDGSKEADASTSPVCGFLMPNHLDGDLEFFDGAGANLGFVRPDPQAGVIWDAAPGVAATVGQTPQRAIPNQFAAGIAQGLLQWGLADATATGLGEDALSAILRIIDSTLWAVDPFASSSDEHLSLLVGHPVAIMRAQVQLEVQEPIAPTELDIRSVSLRLGAVTHWQDGLLGYFVNDDYTRFYCADAAVAGFARKVGPGQGFLDQAAAADNYYQQFSEDIGDHVTEGDTPVNHPYVDTSGLLTIHPNQIVNLTLLVEPHCLVHATTGVLPRKQIGMRREWVAAALAAISPTFRFGPVLVDPKTIRMPVPNEIHGTWSWDHRADITTWQEDPIVAATQDAHLRPDPATGTEGWMRMMPPPPPGTSKS